MSTKSGTAYSVFRLISVPKNTVLRLHRHTSANVVEDDGDGAVRISCGAGCRRAAVDITHKYIIIHRDNNNKNNDNNSAHKNCAE